MKTLNYLVFATLTFTAAAHADPVADLSAHLSEKLNGQLNQMSSELTTQVQVSLETRMAEMLEQLDSKLETTDMSQPVTAEPIGLQVTATRNNEAGAVQ